MTKTELTDFIKRLIVLSDQAKHITFPDQLTKLNVVTLSGLLLDLTNDAKIKKD